MKIRQTESPLDRMMAQSAFVATLLASEGVWCALKAKGLRRWWHRFTGPTGLARQHQDLICRHAKLLEDVCRRNP